MKKLFEEILNGIPDYTEFLTVDELDDSSRALAAKYPETVSIFEFGQTREKRPLLCLRIGNGAKSALMFGCPHPNEPIGTMMLEYFSEKLATDKRLREELGYTWYIVKAWDADGLKLNEGWLKGPFSIYNYSRNFFRPAGYKQVDWTFPVDYKELHFHDTIPETQAMMRLIDEIKPHFIYSLHNSGFGGAYWYITEPLDPIYDEIRAAAQRVNIPLNLGEPEAPFCVTLSPAIYRSFGIEQQYDFMEKYGETNIAEKLKVGNCSESYSRTRYGTFTLLTELPYFYDKRVMDLSEGTVTRRDAVLRNLDERKQRNEFIKSAMEKTRKFIDPENPFLLALEAFTKDLGDASTRNMVESSPDFARKATVAEEFDNLCISGFYNSLSYGMLIRMNEYELMSMKQQGEQNSEKEKALTDAISEAEKAHRTLTDRLEAELDYQVVPIKKLVSVQLECGLIVSDYLKDKEPLSREVGI